MSVYEVRTATEGRRDCLPNTSTFVPNDRSQCLYCVFPIMRCALGAHLDVGLDVGLITGLVAPFELIH